MADPASAVDIAPFLATFHGHINLSEVAAPGTLQESGAISPDINPDTSVMASAYVLSTASGMQTSSQAASVGSQGKPSQEQGQPEEVLSLVTKALDSPLSPISGARAQHSTAFFPVSVLSKLQFALRLVVQQVTVRGGHCWGADSSVCSITQHVLMSLIPWRGAHACMGRCQGGGSTRSPVSNLQRLLLQSPQAW